MNDGVEFQGDDDVENDPTLQRVMQRTSKPLFASVLIYFRIVQNERQANIVLSCIIGLLVIFSTSLVAKAFSPGDHGGLDKYPAQDVSKGV
jgi:hypothetical protein